MVLHKRLMVCASVASLVAGTPASAAPWVRGFVVGQYEYAFRYGGRADFARAGEIEPGVDCPHGSGRHFANPAETRRTISLQRWRSAQEIDWITAPPGVEKTRSPTSTRFGLWNRAIAYRGYRRGIETYVNPWAADDPGQPEVSSRIGDGFNLDGKVKAADFVSADGEKGIDNALYRAWGCDAPWRGNGNANLDMRANDKMQDGLYTMVIRVSGNQNPRNDGDAVVEIGYSPDKIVKDARGGIAIDYSYRILKSAQYTRMKATVKNGVVESEQVAELHSPRIAWFYDQLGDTNFRQGRLRVTMAADGASATGLLGGYRNWRDLYAENTFAQDGGQQGVREHEDHVALYFALRRNADGIPDPVTGRNSGISSAYRLRMTSAYVVDPAQPMDIPKHASEEWRRGVFEKIKANSVRGAETRIPQDVPPGTTEAAVPRVERELVELPSAEFFLKTLDRPHYPDGDVDNEGNPVDERGRRIDRPTPQHRAGSRPMTLIPKEPQ